MVFKNLVESLIKLKRDPDDVLALNTVNTLKRELKNDLIQSYDLCKPVIESNTSLFWNSTSFLDFLFKLNDIPIPKDYKFTTKVDDNYLKELQECKNDNQKFVKWVDDLERKNSKLERALEESKQPNIEIQQNYDKLHEMFETYKTLYKERNAELLGRVTECEQSKLAMLKEKLELVQKLQNYEHTSLNDENQNELDTLRQTLKVFGEKNTNLMTENQFETELKNLRQKLKISEEKNNDLMEENGKIIRDLKRCNIEKVNAAGEYERLLKKLHDQVSECLEEKLDLLRKVQKNFSSQSSEIVDKNIQILDNYHFNENEREIKEVKKLLKTLKTELNNNVRKSHRMLDKRFKQKLARPIFNQIDLMRNHHLMDPNSHYSPRFVSIHPVDDEIQTTTTTTPGMYLQLPSPQQNPDAIPLGPPIKENTERSLVATAPANNNNNLYNVSQIPPNSKLVVHPSIQPLLKNDVLLNTEQPMEDSSSWEFQSHPSINLNTNTLMNNQHEPINIPSEPSTSGINLNTLMNSQSEPSTSGLNAAMVNDHQTKSSLKVNRKKYKKTPINQLTNKNISQPNQTKSTFKGLELKYKQQTQIAKEKIDKRLKIQRLKGKIKLVTNIKKKFKQKLDTVQQQLNECLQSQIELDTLKEQNNALSEENNQLKLTMETALMEKNNQLEQSKRDFENVLKKQRQLTDKLQDKEDVEEFKQQLWNVKNQLSKCQENLEKQTCNNNELNTLKEQTKALSYENDQLKEKETFLTNEINESNHNFELLKATLELDQNSHKEQIENLKDTIVSEKNSHKEQIDNLKATIVSEKNSHKEQIDNLKATIVSEQNSHKEQIENLKDTMELEQNSYKEQIEILKATIASEQGSNHWKQKYAELQLENKEINHTLGKTKRDLLKKKTTSKVNDDNRIIVLLRNHYADQALWEDSFERDWEHLNQLDNTVRKQCKIIQDAASLIEITPQDFGTKIAEIFEAEPNNSLKLKQIAHHFNFLNDNILVSKIENEILKFKNFESVMERLGLNIDTFEEKWNSLKGVVSYIEPTLTNNVDWFDQFIIQFGVRQHYFSTMQIDYPTLEELYKQAVQCSEDHRDKPDWLKRFIEWNYNSLENFKRVKETLKELYALTPDLNTKDITHWAHEFIHRYYNLWYFKSLFEEMYPLPPQYTYEENQFLNFLRQSVEKTHPSIVNDKTWAKLYIEKLVTFVHQLIAKEANFKTFEEWSTTFLLDPNEPTNLKIKPKRAKSSKYDPLRVEDSKLKDYFNVDKISSDSIISNIDTVIKSLFQRLGIESTIKHNLTFQNHLENYISLLPQEMINFPIYYKEWLTILNVSNELPMADFSNLLKTCQTKSASKRSYTYDDEALLPKKNKFALNYTEIEIQNVFHILYKAYFTLKYKSLKNELYTMADIQNQLREKLKFLEKLTKNIRESSLLRIYKEFVMYDLESLTGEQPERFIEVVTTDALFEQTRKLTENYLKQLFNSETTEMN